MTRHTPATRIRQSRTREQSNKPARMSSVDRIRAYQRDWLETTRERSASGEPFAICHGDEFEEIFTTLGIPVLVANYWNFLVIAAKQAGYYSDLLEDHGYPGPHFLGLGLGTSIDPSKAPWGGLPKPLILLGSTRDEEYLRLTELWAREIGCPCYTLDFGFTSHYKKIPPDDWWKRIRDEWETLVDTRRLGLRMAQKSALIRHLETITDRTFSIAGLMNTMALVNKQMDCWAEARELIAESRPCPVSLRDQLAAYQSMWHRGTEMAVTLIEDYVAEIRERVTDGEAGYEKENIRLLYWSTREAPRFQAFLEHDYGAVFVASTYSAVPATYARTVFDGDPLRALSGRHLLLFSHTPSWMLNEARKHQCDGIVLIEPASRHPSHMQNVAEQSGMPCVSLTDPDDSDINHRKLAQFFETRLA
jgi:benzoyl-CoA reductase subunit B